MFILNRDCVTGLSIGGGVEACGGGEGVLIRSFNMSPMASFRIKSGISGSVSYSSSVTGSGLGVLDLFLSMRTSSSSSL